MPLAQNYIDDVSFLESGVPITKPTMDSMNKESAIQQELHRNMNVS